jgi:hypothetical protein
LASFLSRARSILPSPRRPLPVIAIGQRVFVNCTERGESAALFLGDETGKVLSTERVARVADGLEVEVIAWRPRGANETRYRVRVLSTGADGWLPADNLRKLLVSLSQAEPVAAGDGGRVPRQGGPDRNRSSADGGRRRFGQHFDTESSSGSSSSASDEPARRADDRGRRFGQRA